MNTYSFEFVTIITSILKSTVIFAIVLYISELIKLVDFLLIELGFGKRIEGFGKRIEAIDLVVDRIKKIDPSYLLRLSIAMMLSISLFLFSITGNLKLGVLASIILSCMSVIPIVYSFKNPNFNIFSSFHTILIVIPPFLSGFITLALTSFVMLRSEESIYFLLYCFLSAILWLFRTKSYN